MWFSFWQLQDCSLLAASVFWWMRLGELCKFPDGRDWQWGKLGLALVGRAMFSKVLIQLSADGWSCTPSLPRASQVALVVKNLPANAGDIRDRGSVPGSGRAPRGEHGNPLQYSCLENPMDRGVWWATIHRVSKSWTRLKWLSMQDPGLGSTGSMVGLMATYKEDLRQGAPSRTAAASTAVNHCDPCLHRRLSILAGRSGSVSWGITVPFSWVLACARFCSCPPRVQSLFPPVLWKYCNQIPLAFKVRFPGESQSLCGIPRLGSLMWGSEPSQQWENFFGIIVLQFVGCPLGGYGIWFYRDCTPTMSLQFLLVFGSRVSFFNRFQHPPVNVCSTAGCDFGALAGGDEHMSSTLPSWTGSSLILSKVLIFFSPSFPPLSLLPLYFILSFLFYAFFIGSSF